MTTEYVVSLTEYNFATCETVRTWQEVWPSLESLEYATWDQASCEVACETRAVSPSAGCCGGVLPSSASGSGDNHYVAEYTTFNFATCQVESVACSAIVSCYPPVGCCSCGVVPRFWTFTLPTISATVPPLAGVDCSVMGGERVLGVDRCYGAGPSFPSNPPSRWVDDRLVIGPPTGPYYAAELFCGWLFSPTSRRRWYLFLYEPWTEYPGFITVALYQWDAATSPEEDGCRGPFTMTLHPDYVELPICAGLPTTLTLEWY